MTGIGEAKAAQLVAAFELGRRLLADWPTGPLDDPRPARRRGSADPPDGPPRARGAAGRDARHEEPRPARRDGLPGQRVSSSLVRVGELFRDAVRLNAAGVILVHNHPSGDPTPSPDDLHLTAEALAAGRLLDIQLLDHLVIGHDAYVSLRDRGVAFDRPDGRARATD